MLRRESLMRELYDHLSGANRGEALSAAELCDLISEWVGMDMSEGEVLSCIDLMDLDQDGAVSLHDFMVSA
jgi:Ca2+-binding EF-hand superfamily protein